MHVRCGWDDQASHAHDLPYPAQHSVMINLSFCLTNEHGHDGADVGTYRGELAPISQDNHDVTA